MQKKKFICLQLILTLLFVTISVSLAENNGGNFHVTAPQFSSSPKIDGKLESLVWEQGFVIDSFTQYEPLEGSEPSEKTAVFP